MATLKKKGGKFLRIGGKFLTGCVWGLTLCGGSDSGIRICPSDVGNDSSTVVVIDGHCYTINTDPPGECPTITAGPFTTVASCADEACSGGAGCDDCAHTSDTYAVTGLNHLLNNCFTTSTVTACDDSFGAHPTDWNGIIYRAGNSADPSCAGTGNATLWAIDATGSPVVSQLSVYSSDGTCYGMSECTLSCNTGVWQIVVQIGANSGPTAGSVGGSATYQKSGGGTSPAGTYVKITGPECPDGVTNFLPPTLTLV